MPWESTVTHIIPAAWSKLKSFLKQNESPKFLKPEECLNRNWTLDIPYLNFMSPKETIKEISDSIESNLKFSYADTYSFFQI